jgi:hypothetical protein
MKVPAPGKQDRRGFPQQNSALLCVMILTLWMCVFRSWWWPAAAAVGRRAESAVRDHVSWTTTLTTWTGRVADLARLTFMPDIPAILVLKKKCLCLQKTALSAFPYKQCLEYGSESGWIGSVFDGLLDKNPHCECGSGSRRGKISSKKKKN